MERGLPNKQWYLPCADVPENTLVISIYVVLFTVVINGCTMAPLMRRLKMTEIPDDRKFSLGKAAKHLAKETGQYVETLKTHALLKDIDWDAVAACHLDKRQEYDGKVEDTERAAWMHVLGMERASCTAPNVPNV